jgi:GT2 family glycosyltransferase
MMASAPQISVVAPTHNRVRTLTLLLTSLEKQTLERGQFEVVIVGDENDPGQHVVSEFVRRGVLNLRFTSVPNDPWHGKSPALKRNHGAELALGQWVAFIDDDCVADPNWLASALPYFENPSVGAVEGRKVIPRVVPPTLTYRGLLSFTKPGGYQTANMFYRKSVFEEAAGFDTAFPFYLEDTDLAWSVLDLGYEIPYAAEAIVEHPVPPAQPMRLLASAQRGILVPYLFKKHPNLFKASGIRAIGRAHLPYLLGYVALIAACITGRGVWALAVIGALVAMTAAHSVKLFRGCFFTWREVLVTTALLPVVPAVLWIQLMRGNVRHRSLLLR